MTGATTTTAADEWRRHWTLVLACALGISMASMCISSLGTFIEPLERSLGWKRAEISAGLSIYAIVGVICSPLMGNMVDRWGPRAIGLPGVVLCGAAFALFGTATNELLLWYALWVLFSIATQVARPLLWTAALSNHFEKSRGLALAVMFTGLAIGGILAPILAYQLIAALGWRLAYVIMGLGWGGIAGLACYFFLYGRSGPVRGRTEQTVPAEEIPGMSVREALRSHYFIKLATATLLVNSLVVGLTVHMVPLLSGGGLARRDAVALVAMAGATSLGGKFICGILVDRMRGNFIAAFFVSLPMATCALLLVPSDSILFRALPVVLMSLSGGAYTHMLAYLGTRYFGLRAFGTIYGFMSSILAMAVGVGPLLAAFVYDREHSYELALIAGIPMSAIAALLLLSLGRYPDHRAAQPA